MPPPPRCHPRRARSEALVQQRKNGAGGKSSGRQTPWLWALVTWPTLASSSAKPAALPISTTCHQPGRSDPPPPPNELISRPERPTCTNVVALLLKCCSSRVRRGLEHRSASVMSTYAGQGLKCRRVTKSLVRPGAWVGRTKAPPRVGAGFVPKDPAWAPLMPLLHPRPGLLRRHLDRRMADWPRAALHARTRPKSPPTCGLTEDCAQFDQTLPGPALSTKTLQALERDVKNVSKSVITQNLLKIPRA
jgi:hypothetical protein